MDINRLLDIAIVHFESKSYVHSLWLEGSLAENEGDDYSDIDLWVDVDDDYAQQAIVEFRNMLAQHGNLDVDYEIEIEHSKLRHVTFHLDTMPEFARIELNVQNHSRELPFREGVDVIKVLLDKDNTVKYQQPEAIDIDKSIKQQLAKIDFGDLWVRREINRGKYLEALDAFNHWIIEPLIVIARLKYKPYKTEYGLKHLSKDLPSELVCEIEELYKNSNVADISTNLNRSLRLKDRLYK